MAVRSESERHSAFRTKTSRLCMYTYNAVKRGRLGDLTASGAQPQRSMTPSRIIPFSKSRPPQPFMPLHGRVLVDSWRRTGREHTLRHTRRCRRTTMTSGGLRTDAAFDPRFERGDRNPSDQYACQHTLHDGAQRIVQPRPNSGRTLGCAVESRGDELRRCPPRLRARYAYCSGKVEPAIIRVLAALAGVLRTGDCA